jgi:DNA processing protein
MNACAACVARSWLLARLGGHLEVARTQIDEVLALDDHELIAAVGGRGRADLERELLRLDVQPLWHAARHAGVELICRCHSEYPRRLRDLPSSPAVLHVAGGLGRLLELVAEDPVAIVGARRASPYGLDVACSLGRGLARAGLTVVSGMARGIDSAAHAGALEAPAPTVAVLPGPAERPYPARGRRLHCRIVAGGAAVSELPCGSGVWRWTFRARNRIIAALASTTVVVEAGERSGSLLTARFARELGRPVGAVPGRITSAGSAGPNGLLAFGAYVVRGPQDVVDQLFGAGVRVAAADSRPALTAELRRVLDAVARGDDSAGAFGRAGIGVQEGLSALAELELAGYVARGAGGRWRVVP